MIAKEWLTAERILLNVEAASIQDVIGHASAVLARLAGVEAEQVRGCIEKSAQSPRIAIGSGVVIPHAELSQVNERTVVLLHTASPIDFATPDGKPADLFFVMLGPPRDPKGHLLFLAHIARLCEDAGFLQGIRQAQAPDAVLGLVEAIEQRQAALVQAPAEPYAAKQLVLIVLSGERALDRLLVDLVDEGYGQGSVVDVQTLDEAAAREVPLFSGFRDLFGDTGGRRMVLLFAEEDKSQKIVELVHTICKEEKAREAQIHLLPVRSPWVWQAPEDAEKSAGH